LTDWTLLARVAVPEGLGRANTPRTQAYAQPSSGTSSSPENSCPLVSLRSSRPTRFIVHGWHRVHAPACPGACSDATRTNGLSGAGPARGTLATSGNGGVCLCPHVLPSPISGQCWRGDKTRALPDSSRPHAARPYECNRDRGIPGMAPRHRSGRLDSLHPTVLQSRTSGSPDLARHRARDNCLANSAASTRRAAPH
jgi:hypothetical protein